MPAESCARPPTRSGPVTTGASRRPVPGRARVAPTPRRQGAHAYSRGVASCTTPRLQGSKMDSVSETAAWAPAARTVRPPASPARAPTQRVPAHPHPRPPARADPALPCRGPTQRRDHPPPPPHPTKVTQTRQAGHSPNRQGGRMRAGPSLDRRPSQGWTDGRSVGQRRSWTGRTFGRGSVGLPDDLAEARRAGSEAGVADSW